SSISGSDAMLARLSPCRWPDIGRRLARLIERAGFEVIDIVTEASRGTELGRVPLDIEGRISRRVSEGVITEELASAWLAEQRERDRTGRLRARWVKQLVVARRVCVRH